MGNDYKFNYDYAIVYALLRYKYLGYRELKEKIEGQEFLNLNKEISTDVFNYHIKKLKENKYIKRNIVNWIRGKKIPYSLTRMTKKEIELGIFQITYKDTISQEMLSYPSLVKQEEQTTRNYQNNIIETRKKIFQIIVNLASTQAGPIYIDDENELYPGTISIDDIMRGIPGSSPFWHYNFNFSREELEDAFQLLEKEKIISKINIPSKEPRYIISNPKLAEFVLECLNLKDGMINIRFHLIRKHVRNPSPLERIYHEFHDGKKHTDSIFYDEVKILKENKIKNKQDPNYHKLRQEMIERIEDLDYNIYNYAQEIRKKYKRIFKKYPVITKFVFESVYPLFLQNEIEKTIKKIEVNGKWIQKPHHGIAMISPWGSRQAK